MTSAFNRIVNYEGTEWYEYLDRSALYEIFKPVVEYFTKTDREIYTQRDTVNITKGVIRYITFAYSIESELVTTQSEWLENKKKVFEYVDLPPVKEIEDDIIRFKCSAVLQSVKNWLHFQNEKAFTNYMMLKDLQQQMQEAALRDIIKNTTGEIDYSAKMDCAKYSVELASMIKDAESNLIQNNPKLKEAVGEVSKLSKAERNTMGVENFV